MQNIYAFFLEPEDASVKHLKAELLMRILTKRREAEMGLTQMSKALAVSVPRACDLVNGHLEKFSLEMLHRFCLRLKLEGLR